MNILGETFRYAFHFCQNFSVISFCQNNEYNCFFTVPMYIICFKEEMIELRDEIFKIIFENLLMFLKFEPIQKYKSSSIFFTKYLSDKCHQNLGQCQFFTLLFVHLQSADAQKKRTKNYSYKKLNPETFWTHFTECGCILNNEINKNNLVYLIYLVNYCQQKLY